jgi:colanic acid/amylovoran biosynthesis protein
MLEVALARLRSLWPDAVISYFGDPADPAVARLGVVAVPIHGRRLWFDEPFLDLGPFARLPALLAKARSASERYLRRRWPALARTLLTFRLRQRRREEESRAVETYFRTVTNTDLAFACGMGGITDAFPDYTCELLGTINLALAYGARAVLLGQGIGPLEDRVLRAEARAVLPRVDFIALRERRQAQRLLLSLGVAQERIMTTGDDAIELAFDRRPATLGTCLGVNLRLASYAEIDRLVLERTREALRDFVRTTPAQIIALPISHAPSEADSETIRVLLADYDSTTDGGRALDTAVKVIEQVKRCRLVLTGSYHAAVFALSMGIPAIGLARSAYYDQKFRGLTDQFSEGCEVIGLNDADWPAQLRLALQRSWMTAQEVRPKLLIAAAKQVALGREAYQRVRDLVEAGG